MDALSHAAHGDARELTLLFGLLSWGVMTQLPAFRGFLHMTVIMHVLFCTSELIFSRSAWEFERVILTAIDSVFALCTVLHGHDTTVSAAEHIHDCVMGG